MNLAERVCAPWKAEFGLVFQLINGKTVLAEKRFDGPLVVQKPFSPEGHAVCHAIVVHPPAGIAGGDELTLDVNAREGASVLLTTPGAGKWYRSAGPWARQKLRFDVPGDLEWLPQETIVFDAALADMDCEVSLGPNGRYLGWEILCLGRTGSGERFSRGRIRMKSTISRDGIPLWWEQGTIAGGERLMSSAAGLGGKTVCATLLAAAPGLDRAMVSSCREEAEFAVTLLPGLLVARMLCDSSEQAKAGVTRLWSKLRPQIFGRAAVEPRIWKT